MSFDSRIALVQAALNIIAEGYESAGTSRQREIQWQRLEERLHTLQRYINALYEGDAPELQELCGEAFDCDMAAANPAAYMVAADEKLERDREWALKEVRAQVLEECAAFTRHAEDCEIWRPGAPACTCGYQAWLDRELPGWYARQASYSHNSRFGTLGRVDRETLFGPSTLVGVDFAHDVDEGHIVHARVEGNRLVAIENSVPIAPQRLGDIVYYAPDGTTRPATPDEIRQHMQLPLRDEETDDELLADVLRCDYPGCTRERGNGRAYCQSHRTREQRSGEVR